jgi:hypothetical protein
MNAERGLVAWGAASHGGVIPSESLSLLSSNVLTVKSTRKAFAAMKGDYSVVSWGNMYQGGDQSDVASYLSVNGVGKVYELCSNEAAFSAALMDGGIAVWGHMTVLGITGGKFISTGDSYIYGCL